MKKVVITGATDGIGKATARGLAERGWEILLVARNPKKAEATIEEISAKTGNKKISYVTCDLSSLKEVAKASKEISKKFPKIDALINNAGLISPERQTSKDGYELTFAVNHLAHVLLTEKLLPRLKAAGSSRILILTSKLYGNAKPDPNDWQKTKKYTWLGAYCDSKLFNLYYMQDLFERLKKTKITVNAIHPGVVNTELSRDFGGILGSIYNSVKNLFFITPEKSALDLIYLTDAPGMEGVSGQYFENRKQVKYKGLALDTNLKQKLLEETKKFLKSFL
ncbi:short-chain dehydrogenase [Leptospira perolatii]|uniref:Short-chain dehydrogenase n=1 Tax=Leptospira perolatii TaxID=2023191 RepID=A0A2M9ZPM2_9LEPT|nr:SDR family oxidoreductase [Leptospira perolatii]PJZ70961.1 short-chain dehydrogenase [Leptospira perolatii]PJZ74030.1 short-chain dehydrogenase [Leptospira perolatii]